jgi:hypothetical protein
LDCDGSVQQSGDGDTTWQEKALRSSLPGVACGAAGKGEKKI